MYNNTVRDKRNKQAFTVALPVELIDEFRKASTMTGVRLTHMVEKAFEEYLQKINPESDNLQKSAK